MALSVQVTVSMPVEMVEKADEQAEAHDMSRAEYIRHLVRRADDSPFDSPQPLNGPSDPDEGTGAEA